METSDFVCLFVSEFVYVKKSPNTLYRNVADLNKHTYVSTH